MILILFRMSISLMSLQIFYPVESLVAIFKCAHLIFFFMFSPSFWWTYKFLLYYPQSSVFIMGIFNFGLFYRYLIFLKRIGWMGLRFGLIFFKLFQNILFVAFLMIFQKMIKKILSTAQMTLKFIAYRPNMYKLFMNSCFLFTYESLRA